MMSDKDSTTISKDQLEEIKEYYELDQGAAIQAGVELGYTIRMFVNASLPHRDPKTDTFKRINGNETILIKDVAQVGLPYGSIARLILAYLATEAVKTRQPQIDLGKSQRDFMKKLGLTNFCGGKRGSTTSVKKQLISLFSCTIYYKNEGIEGIEINMNTIGSYLKMKFYEEKDQWQSYVILSDAFYKEITKHPIPLDLKTLSELKKSPIAMDIYCWLTFRMSYITKTQYIPFTLLQRQFGSCYPFDKKGRSNFQVNFKKGLKKVQKHFEFTAEIARGRLILKAGPTHIRMLKKVS
jgi:hypothetical protein